MEALAVRSTKRVLINANEIESSYCNFQGIPYIQYLLTLDKDRLRTILFDLGLSKFSGSFEDIVNIFHLASLLGWDRNKARNFCRQNYTGKKEEYLQNLIQYVCDYDLLKHGLGSSDFKNTERYRYLIGFGDQIFIMLYLVYFYYSIGEIRISREIKIGKVYEQVVFTSPKIYEQYILSYLSNPSETLKLLQMVPPKNIGKSNNSLNYFLRSIPQYEEILLNPREKSEETDEKILSKYEVDSYLDHNDLVEKTKNLTI